MRESSRIFFINTMELLFPSQSLQSQQTCLFVIKMN